MAQSLCAALDSTPDFPSDVLIETTCVTSATSSRARWFVFRGAILAWQFSKKLGVTRSSYAMRWKQCSRAVRCHA
jgi:hypothetical protein